MQNAITATDSGRNSRLSNLSCCGVRCGDVWWVDFTDSLTGDRKIRPGVVVGDDRYNANPRNPLILVVPCASRRDGRQVRRDQVLVDPPEGGVTRSSVVNVYRIQPVPRGRLRGYMGRVREDTLGKIESCLAVVIG